MRAGYVIQLGKHVRFLWTIGIYLYHVQIGASLSPEVATSPHIITLRTRILTRQLVP